MELGDGTYITASEARTSIRGGGFGSSAWLARVTGTDPKYGLRREFVRADKSGMSGSGRSGSIEWGIPRAGLYEWRGFCVGSTAVNWESSGFCLIDGEDVKEVSRSEALVIAGDMDGEEAAAP